MFLEGECASKGARVQVIIGVGAPPRDLFVRTTDLAGHVGEVFRLVSQVSGDMGPRPSWKSSFDLPIIIGKGDGVAQKPLGHRRQFQTPIVWRIDGVYADSHIPNLEQSPGNEKFTRKIRTYVRV